MRIKSIRSQVKSGLLLAANVLLAVTTSMLLLGGMLIAFYPSNHWRVIGWIFLVVATIVMIVTIQKWVKALPGILGYGTLGAIIMTASGHLPNKPDITVSTRDGVIITLLMAGNSALSFTFMRRSLNLVDRAALMAFVFILAWGAEQGSSNLVAFIALGAAFCCLLFAWAYNRLRRIKTDHSQLN